MSRPTAKFSPKSLKEDDQDFVRKARRSPVDRLYGNHTGNQGEGCELIDASLSSC